MKKSKWAVPIAISEAEMVFPANVINKFLPQMKDIPKEFHKLNNPWRRKASSLFFKGGTIDLKPDVDVNMAYRHLNACLGSFEPKHEHKKAGVAYLLSLWCKSPE